MLSPARGFPLPPTIGPGTVTSCWSGFLSLHTWWRYRKTAASLLPCRGAGFPPLPGGILHARAGHSQKSRGPVLKKNTEGCAQPVCRMQGEGSCASRLLGKGFKSSVPGDSKHLNLLTLRWSPPHSHAGILPVHAENNTQTPTGLTKLSSMQKWQAKLPRRCKTHASCFAPTSP